MLHWFSVGIKRSPLTRNLSSHVIFIGRIIFGVRAELLVTDYSLFFFLLMMDWRKVSSFSR